MSRLRETTGISVGGSSGAVLAACATYLEAHPGLVDVVCVCADGGDNYANSIFNDDWLLTHGLDLSKERLWPRPGHCDIACQGPSVIVQWRDE